MSKKELQELEDSDTHREIVSFLTNAPLEMVRIAQEDPKEREIRAKIRCMRHWGVPDTQILDVLNKPYSSREPENEAKAAGLADLPYTNKVEDATPEETPAPRIKTMDVVSKFLSSKRNDLAEGSLVKYSSSFRTFAKAYPYLPMTPESIEDYLAARPASSSKRYLYALLSELYEFAHERHDIPNVMEKIKRPRKGKSKESDYLTLEQLKILLNAIQDDRLTGMVELMAGEGFRRSEIHRANVSDIFEDKIRAHGKEAEEWLPLLPEIRDLLLRQANGRSGNEPLFTSKTTGGRLGVEQINVVVRRLFKQAGINGVRTSPHTLRHTFCTLMEASGCDRLSVELLMRHRTQNTTSIYSHVGTEQRLELLRPKLERFSPIRLVDGHNPRITGNNR